MPEDNKKHKSKRSSLVNIKNIKELVEMMGEHDLVEIKIVDADNEIHLKRPQPEVTQQIVTQVPAAAAAVSAPVMAAPAVVTPAPAAAAPAGDPNLNDLESPIVGTFYTAPSPDADSFVKVGDTVNEETVVCIIEAMKVMNEIKAEMNGVIEQILVSNGEAVEFGQPLFKVRPA